MNSEYGKKSPQGLKEQAKKQMQIASKAEPCVAVTEQNWKALISTQTAQIDMLKSILDEISELTTKEEIRIYLNRQMNSLQEVYRQFQCNGADLQEGASGYDEQLRQSDKQCGEECFTTGWEHEREIFIQYQSGGGETESSCEDTVFPGFDTDSYYSNNGNDIAYLVANLTNILDSNHPVEDCTTMKKPRKERKNIQENPQGGFGMKM